MNSITPVQSQSAQMAVWRGVLRFMMQALPAVHHYHQVARCSLGTSLLEMPSWHHSKRRFDEQVWFVEYVKNTHKCLWGGRMSAVRHSRGGWRDQSGCCADLHTEGASVKDVWGGGLEERRRAMGCWGITKIIANNTKHCCVVRHAWQQSWPLTAERNKQFIEWARIHICTVVRLKRWQLPMWRNAASCQTLSHIYRCRRNQVSRTFHKNKSVKFLNKRQRLTQSLMLTSIHLLLVRYFSPFRSRVKEN